MRKNSGIAFAAIVLFAAFTASAQSELSIGAFARPEPTRLVIPINLDLALADVNVQGLTFKVHFSPADAVKDITVQRAGMTATLEPLFEAKPRSDGAISYIAAFKAPLLAGVAGSVAEIHITLARPVENLSLKFDEELTSLTSIDGSDVRQVRGGRLRLIGRDRDTDRRERPRVE